MCRSFDDSLEIWCPQSEVERRRALTWNVIDEITASQTASESSDATSDERGCQALKQRSNAASRCILGNFAYTPHKRAGATMQLLLTTHTSL